MRDSLTGAGTAQLNEGNLNELMLQLPVLGADAKSSTSTAEENSRKYWRSLDELADSPEFDEFIHREYPSQTEVLIDPVSRRSFLKLMGASVGLAGLAACTTQPKEEVIPYIKQPEELVPGKPLYFATAMPLFGEGLGLLVRSNEGRPTKIEGNTEHPSSLGAAHVWAQASILGMYDPDRSKAVLNAGDIRSWGNALATIGGRATGFGGTKQGQGLYFLMPSSTSPSLAAMVKEVATKYPMAKWHKWDPIGGALAGTGKNVQYRLDKADRVVSLDSDFMMMEPGSVRHAHDFIQKRRVSKADPTMSRFYVAETTVTATGANADNRIAVRPSEFDSFVGALAAAVGAGSGSHAANEKQQAFVNAMAKDLLANRGKSVIIAGQYQTPYVHSMTAAINQALGNVGQTVFYGDSVEVNPADDLQSISALAADMQAGKVEMLVLLGGVNPVYSAPADLHFVDALKKVPYIVHHGLYFDESAEFAHWHIPEAHYLESWGDARSLDGTTTIMQPLIEPLYGGKTMHEVLAIFSSDPSRTSHDIVKGYWTGGSKGTDIDTKWQRSLHDGLIAGTMSTAGGAAPTFAALQPMAPSTSGYDVVFRPDPSVLDGRFANNGWLQELPKPITKLTWDNAALISPNTAKKLNVTSDVEMKGGNYKANVIYIGVGDQHIKLPVWVTPGHPDDTVTVQLGYGRWRGGQVANGKGVNVNPIRSSKNAWIVTGAKVVKTDEVYELAGTQIHFTMEGREPVKATTLEDYIKNPNFVHEHEEEPTKDASIFPKFEYRGYAWGMTIDLNNCIGCNACIIACQSENNIPVVGKEQVQRSREMHWIRVDRYYTGAAEDPDTYWQPIPCMQCENAPCELVCPVEATSHSAEGLNDMTYNRCVGTRYCGNNCPYKVRRFNFLLFQDWNTPSYKMMRNPEVSVRSRGVMEKCTYCVQRIQSAKIDSEKENREVRDGEIVTACEATCPTEAIVFGNINDPNSRVAKLKADSRNYSLLAELNTQPRTTYLGSVRNPNPELAGSREQVERA